jgi:hypothetical protein
LYVLKGLIEGDGGSKVASGVLGISCSPMLEFTQTLCKNLNLKTWKDKERVYIRFNAEDLEDIIDIVFLPDISTDKKKELQSWCKKLVKNRMLIIKNKRKVPNVLIEKMILDFYKMINFSRKVSYYKIAKKNGFHLVTVLNILKGKTRVEDTKKICKKFKLPLPWEFIRGEKW